MDNNLEEKYDRKLTDTPANTETTELAPAENSSKVRMAAKKVKSAVMAIGTRTIVIICSVLLIGFAVVLNYVLADTTDPVEFEPTGEMTDDGSMYVPDTYFASSVLSREQARDEAIEVLKTVVNNEAALESAKETALGDIARIAGEIEMEANIETLIKSKGFEECIAVVTGSNANIIVKSDGLLQNELSQIKEIVYEQAGIDPVNIKIVEKN